jgi:uncharacterized protein (TIGR00369 family)
MQQEGLVNTTGDHGCFGCGDRNPAGLHLKFFRRDDAVVAEITPHEHFEGYVHMVHGGIVSTMLDEAMSWAVIDRGLLAVTAKMEVRFRRPVPVRERLTLSGRVVNERRRAVKASGEIRDRSGEILATATGLFLRVSPEQQRSWESIYLGGQPDEVS